MDTFYRDKIILITGAAGTVGQELVRQLVKLDPAEIRLFDNNESDLFLLGNEYRRTGRVRPYLGDVRDEKKLINVSRGVDLIFHAAAFKHVGFAEYNPFEAVQTNINGVKNVVQAALFNEVPRVIFTSSDKAVNPTNVMGTSKLMGERIISAANIVNNGHSSQIFSSVRFGNVLGSRGSVVPIFAEQILRGGPVTITDARMTRFVMTIQQAAHLLLEAAIIARGGEVLVTKMLTMRIIDLAQAMIELLTERTGQAPEDIKIKYIGSMPGEKLYEELLSQEELGRTKELSYMFAILPAFRGLYQNIDYHYNDVIHDELDEKNCQPYVSSLEIPMTLEEIKAYLEHYNILGEFIHEVQPEVLPYRDHGFRADVKFAKNPKPAKWSES